MWIFQKGLYEGTETCQKDLYVCVFASLRQYEDTVRTTTWRYLVTAGKIERLLVRVITLH